MTLMKVIHCVSISLWMTGDWVVLDDFFFLPSLWNRYFELFSFAHFSSALSAVLFFHDPFSFPFSSPKPFIELPSLATSSPLFVCMQPFFLSGNENSLGLIFRFLFFFFWTDRLAESVSYWGHSRHASLSFAHLCAIPSRFAICDSANRSSFVASRRSQSRLGTGDNDGETRCRRRAVSVPFFLLLNPIHFSFRFELERSFISPSLRRNSSILLSSAAEPVPSWKEKVDVPTMTATPNVCY